VQRASGTRRRDSLRDRFRRLKFCVKIFVRGPLLIRCLLRDASSASRWLKRRKGKVFPASHRARGYAMGCWRHARVKAHAGPDGKQRRPRFDPQRGWRIERSPGRGAGGVDAAIIATGGLSVPNTGSTGLV
jgi:predicted flavoprotein YhiN